MGSFCKANFFLIQFKDVATNKDDIVKEENSFNKNQMKKIKQPAPDIEKQMDEEIEKDLMSFNYVLYLGSKIKKETPNIVINVDSNFIKGQMKIAESLVSKERASQIKRIANAHANIDFKIIKKEYYKRDNMKNETKHPFKGYVFSSGTTNLFDQETNYITLIKNCIKFQMK